MKTLKSVISQSGIPASVVRACVRRVGIDRIHECTQADAGWPGFTSYADTVKFYKAHRADINAMVENMAGDMGESATDMVAGFQCLAGRDMRRTHTGCQDARAESLNRAAKAEYLPSVYRCLGGGRLTDDDTQVANALAWFALEEVARAFES